VEAREASARPAPTTDALDDALIMALSHPLRHSILRLLNTRVMSPSDIADKLDAKVADVSYHVGKLESVGAVELVRTEQRRGVLKSFYRATMRPMLGDAQYEQLPVSVRRRMAGHTLEQIWEHLRQAAEADGFDRGDVHVSWTPFELDDEGYAAMTQLVEETLERAFAIQGEVVDRRAATPHRRETKTELVLMHFLRDPRPRGDTAA
jgi:DNA-binding transcriptional ArsR family regulator